MDMQCLKNSIDGFEMASPAVVISHLLLGMQLYTKFSPYQSDGDVASNVIMTLYSWYKCDIV